MINHKKAFTLPEVLIVIGIIGVVAAILMPTVIREFEMRSNSYREANIANKVTQAMELMNAAGDLHYYQTTAEFVEALKKHLKVIKVCGPDNIDECWSSKVVTTSSKGTYEVKNAKTGRDLHTGNNTDTAGLILADGAQIILTYNPEIGATAADNITPSTKTLPVGFGKTKEFAYTTSITSPIDFVMDVNGTSGPNAETTDDGEYHDIRSFKIASFSLATCPGFKVNGVCVYNLGTNYNSLNCEDSANEEYCLPAVPEHFDYTAGAMKACKDLGLNLPSRDDLVNLLNTGDERLPQLSEGGTWWSSSIYSGRRTKIFNGGGYWRGDYANGNGHASKYKVICIGTN